MTWTLGSLGLSSASLASAMLAAALAAQSPTAAPQEASMHRTFSEGLKRLGLLFSDIGSLASGPEAGEIWKLDKRTGKRRRIGEAADLSWPAPSPDGTAVYALRGAQVICIVVADGSETPVGSPAEWRKLLGVLPDGVIIGFVEEEPFPRPALLSKDGKRTDLPPPADDGERRQVGVLLQEARSYADGARLEVRNSERGGRGRDVFLVEGGTERNLSDCGDDLCGQPARAIDGETFYYVRGARL
jgi:hypothetical protein